MSTKKEALTYYPLAVKLGKRRVVVVGGGIVAERKVDALRKAGARVRVVSPTVTPALRRLARRDKIEWINRYVRKGDVRGAYIIVAATNDTATNRAVNRWAGAQRIWINVVDKPVLSDFISPAVFHANNAILAVYTDGRDPKLSRDVKNYLKEHWDEFLSYRR